MATDTGVRWMARPETTLLVLLTVLGIVTGMKEKLLIGAIFIKENSTEEGMVRFAIDKVNANDSVLPNHQLEYVGNHTAMLADFESIQIVCYQLAAGATTIIGPMTSSTVKASHPMCQGLHVPMIAPSATNPMLQNKDAYRYLLRMMSPDSTQSRALVAFVQHFRWDTVAILTDNTDYGINGLLEFQTLAAENKWRVLSVQQFEATQNTSDVDAIEQLQAIKGTGARVILLNCLSQHAVGVLQQAAHEGMLLAGWVWIVTDGVAGGTKMADLVSEHPEWIGLVGTRPDTTNGALYRDFTEAWSAADPTYYYGAGVPNDAYLPVWSLMYFDSVLVYAQAMHDLLERDEGVLNVSSRDCREIPTRPWSMGPTLYDYMIKVSTDGVTRKLEFDKSGGPSPKQSAFHYVTLTADGWEKFGRWSAPLGADINITGTSALGGETFFEVRDYVGDLMNKTLRVVTVVDPPFVFKHGPADAGFDGVECTGNDCYYGYAVDLLKRVASDLGFRYIIHDIGNGFYGLKDPVTGNWNGMVSQLIPDEDGMTEADIGVGAFTITSGRQQVISFTKPFRDLQIGILFGSPAEELYDPWSFLIPLTHELWGLTLGTAFVVAFAITILDKLSPYGHYGRKAMIDLDTEYEAMDKNDDGTVDYWEEKEWRREKATMSVTNAVLWSLASLFEQGGERHPKSWSARVVAGAWWVGALIIVQSYTANLAAFLTIKSSGEEINSVNDLARQTVIKYGTIKESQVQEYFDTALRSPYKEMGDQIRKWETYFENVSIAANYTEQQNGSFALLYDMPSVQYWKGQSCRFRLVTNGFGHVGYGFGLPLDSIYTKELTIKIYHLREAGFLDTLDDKWITRTATCAESGSGKLQDDTVQIGMPSLWGVFWIIYSGFVLSSLVLVVEWIVSAARAVDPSGEEGPKTFWGVIKMRFQLFRDDVAENWFIINFKKAELRERQSRLRNLSAQPDTDVQPASNGNITYASTSVQ